MTKKDAQKKEDDYNLVLNRAIKLGYDTFGAKVFLSTSEDKFKKNILKVVIGDNVFTFISAHNYLDFLQKRIDKKAN